MKCNYCMFETFYFCVVLSNSGKQKFLIFDDDKIKQEKKSMISAYQSYEKSPAIKFLNSESASNL